MWASQTDHTASHHPTQHQRRRNAPAANLRNPQVNPASSHPAHGQPSDDSDLRPSLISSEHPTPIPPPPTTHHSLIRAFTRPACECSSTASQPSVCPLQRCHVSWESSSSSYETAIDCIRPGRHQWQWATHHCVPARSFMAWTGHASL